MAALTRFCATLALCAGVQGALPPLVAAQEPPGRLPDSVRWRLLDCGTYGPILQRREATRDVQVALGLMISCPEGPAVIAGLWDLESGADTKYLETLVSVSSIRHRPIADALVRTMADRGRPTLVRLRAMGVLLARLTGDIHTTIWFQAMQVGPRYTFDSQGRIVAQPVDSTIREVRFNYISSHASGPTPIDAAQRAGILAAIALVAADSSDVEDMRLAARAVHQTLLLPQYSR